ncbi:MAG TPA: hypothetical protein PKD00_00435 [Burkholderiales bacterium]|nr:hypothetical protein [Burkholderiales bacterium]
MVANIDVLTFHNVIVSLIDFSMKSGCLFTYPTPGDILDACENPPSIASMVIGGKKRPAPQTGQMGLEYKLFETVSKGIDFSGLFCLTQSYRDEKEIIEGRHNIIFPMFEVELLGDVEVMFSFIKNLLSAFGFPPPVELDYEYSCEQLNVDIIGAEEEQKLYEIYGPVIALRNFPERSNPFWNMKRHDGKAKKIDILLYGVEVIGAAERETDPNTMFKKFFSIENGEYSKTLIDLFGGVETTTSLNKYLSNSGVSIVRSGFGIGITRFIKALHKRYDEKTKQPENSL